MRMNKRGVNLSVICLNYFLCVCAGHCERALFHASPEERCFGIYTKICQTKFITWTNTPCQIDLISVSYAQVLEQNEFQM